MKIKPLIAAITLAALSASIAMPSNAAPIDSKKINSNSANLAVKTSLEIKENSTARAVAIAQAENNPQTSTAKTNDRLNQLIEHKQKAPAVAAPVAATAAVLQDAQSDGFDDITDGQAVAAPTQTWPTGMTSEQINDYNLNQQKASSSTDAAAAAIKSIENIDGKKHTTLDLSSYAKQVNDAVWSPNMKVNSAMTIKLQALLDWNHASPGPIDGGWGMNSKKALINFQNMKGLKPTGTMDQKTWDALIKNVPANKPVLVSYTLTDEDVNTKFAAIPASAEAKSKMKGLYYENIKEMLGERFHMDVRYLEKLNKNKSYKAGETITVLNTRDPLNQRITRVVANKADKTLYAYNGDKLVATYPTTIGSDSTPSPQGTFKIVNKVKMPWYKATVGEGDQKQVHMLPPGPNSPVGVVWMGLSKPSYGLHGSPKPEGISRQASAGCVRLTNWDVLEVYANIDNGATVELK
ncbi:L,D-transpeptidase family protein [Psychrobacter ciconiae]|uniref:L,D-transpeptidase family protein n=1 Tax=Psychrobacter ciconiae TaxID=1553449 RepID=UPI00191B179B|nr:L,D-transpeptidase family protein [Psychrobacter ciconiae]